MTKIPCGWLYSCLLSLLFPNQGWGEAIGFIDPKAGIEQSVVTAPA